MQKTPQRNNSRLGKLLAQLSYAESNGWISADHFAILRAHRFAMQQARDLMSVTGAFCWVSGQGATTVIAPLVYIATASDRTQAQAIHRKVWSQGLVPFLLVLTPDEVISCSGFQYRSENWTQLIKTCEWKSTDTVPPAVWGKAIDSINAARLRSSLFWREHAIDVMGRVDQQLLVGLDELSWNLMEGTNVSRRLRYTAANGLIGKLLYVFFLTDRGIISQDWLNERGHEDIKLHEPQIKWSKESLWELLDDLDSIFNGSVFPLSTEDREDIDHSHINLVRAVMKHGAKTNREGLVQLSFIDIDLGVLRVETLSAVYEQFLENVKCGERRRVGAYYTPPFLVDLVLDRVEEEQPLKDGVTVLDPAAGSGVFLVGAYRRILENVKATSAEPLSLDTVRGLLTRNIFGVERNRDACHVAAFSLYLTMLDYVNPRDLRMVAEGKDPNKLFPQLVGNNLHAQDFFYKGALAKIPPIYCVVGNPPWQTLGILGSPSAKQWASRNPESPIGNDQAAELFVWKALRNHMAVDGILAMLIPAKSFVNPTASRFRTSLTVDFSVCGAINFSHLRHKLFVGAKHACAAIFVRNQRPSIDSWTWIYAPLSISQPVASREDWPWTLVLDQSDVQYVRQSTLGGSVRAWFEAFMLRPIDRQIHSYINDVASTSKIALLGTLCKGNGAAYKRGGSTTETGLAAKYLANEDSHTENYSSNGTGQTLELFTELSNISFPRKTNQLPLSQLAKVKDTYKNQFSGNFLLVPRNFRNIRFVPYPMGYTSSFMAIFFDKPGKEVSAVEKKFLDGMGKYLSSRTALYFMATIGRRWLMDRRNVEPKDLAVLPVPFTGPQDDRLEKILTLDGEELEKYILDALGLTGDLRKGIQEFLDFRMHFQDGNVPATALSVPSKSAMTNYSKVMQRSLEGLVGREGAFKIAYRSEVVQGIGVVVAQFLERDQVVDDSSIQNACDQAVIHYGRQGNNSFADSLSISMPTDSMVCMIKPLEFYRWTVDSAYADSRRVIRSILGDAC